MGSDSNSRAIVPNQEEPPPKQNNNNTKQTIWRSHLHAMILTASVAAPFQPFVAFFVIHFVETLKYPIFKNLNEKKDTEIKTCEIITTVVFYLETISRPILRTQWIVYFSLFLRFHSSWALIQSIL